MAKEAMGSIAILHLTTKGFNTHFRRIMKALDEKVAHVIFRKLRVNRGWYLSNGDIICIDLDPREPIIPTLIHELIHVEYPELEEPEVLALECAMVSKMTVRRYKTLLAKLITKLKFKKTIFYDTK